MPPYAQRWLQIQSGVIAMYRWILWVPAGLGAYADRDGRSFSESQACGSDNLRCIQRKELRGRFWSVWRQLFCQYQQQKHNRTEKALHILTR